MKVEYVVAFWTSLSLTLLVWFLHFRTVVPVESQNGKQVSKLRRAYLLVYGVMVAGDWLQGPYVYALYDSYGYKRSTIAGLFVAGFGSSMLAGTCVGSVADRVGRRRMTFVYALLYSISCALKHWNNLVVLMIGRVLGGIATSLLMSVFESWIVCEHAKRDIPGLSQTLSKAMLVNSLVAILSGLLAQAAASAFPLHHVKNNFYVGGDTMPFDVAIVFLTFGSVLAMWLWDENTGQVRSTNDWTHLSEAVRVLLKSKAICLLGLAQSCFEGSMYLFVFMWSPALSSGSRSTPPFGLVFSTFMVACMFGSQLFDILVRRFCCRVPSVLSGVLAVGSLSLGVGPFQNAFSLEPRSADLQFVGFLVFECCVGVYYPCIGTLKSEIVTEEYRSSIYNLFRVPLNGIVLVVLLCDLSVVATFAVSSSLLFLAFVFAALLSRAHSTENEFTQPLL